MQKDTILAIKLDQRSKEASKVQEVLTQHGCSIRGRFGIHNGNPQECSDDGLIILDLIEESNKITPLIEDLKKIGGLKINSMEI